jgi:hypothetical protein
MAGSHDPLSITAEDGEVVVSVFNIDTYDSARVRLDPEEAGARARELLDTAAALAGAGDTEGDDRTEPPRSDDAPRSEMGVPPGAPPTAFRNQA